MCVSQTSPTGRPGASVWEDAASAPGEMDMTPGPQPWALGQASRSPNPCLLSYGGGAQARCPSTVTPPLSPLERGVTWLQEASVHRVPTAWGCSRVPGHFWG